MTDCQKQHEAAAASEPVKVDITAKVKFEKSDRKLEAFLNQFEDSETSQEVRPQNLCKDCPDEYKKNYMPDLLKSSPTDFTAKKLLLDSTLNYYKNTFGIKCG